MVGKINISIDDVSPHPMSSTRVLQRCMQVIDVHPTVKFTLFVPVAYWRTIGTTATSAPLELSEHPKFCEELLSLPRENFEVAYHGLHHGIPGRSNNDELQNVGYDEACGIIERMVDGANRAGLGSVFKGILRPPAWRMSPHAFQAAEDLGIRTFALSPDPYAMATYAGAQSGRRVVYYNCCPPAKPLATYGKTEVVYHACEWDSNYLDASKAVELIDFLIAHPLRPAFIEELVDG